MIPLISGNLTLDIIVSIVQSFLNIFFFSKSDYDIKRWKKSVNFWSQFYRIDIQMFSLMWKIIKSIGQSFDSMDKLTIMVNLGGIY